MEKSDVIVAAEIIAAALDRQTAAMDRFNGFYLENIASSVKGVEVNQKMLELHQEADKRCRVRDEEYNERERIGFIMQFLSPKNTPDFVWQAIVEMAMKQRKGGE